MGFSPKWSWKGGPAPSSSADGSRDPRPQQTQQRRQVPQPSRACSSPGSRAEPCPKHPTGHSTGETAPCLQLLPALAPAVAAWHQHGRGTAFPQPGRPCPKRHTLVLRVRAAAIPSGLPQAPSSSSPPQRRVINALHCQRKQEPAFSHPLVKRTLPWKLQTASLLFLAHRFPSPPVEHLRWVFS